MSTLQNIADTLTKLGNELKTGRVSGQGAKNLGHMLCIAANDLADIQARTTLAFDNRTPYDLYAHGTLVFGGHSEIVIEETKEDADTQD